MKNVTISLPDQVAQWARVWAAKHERSLSGMLSDLLRERMEQERQYETSMQAYLAIRATALKSPSDTYPTRDEIHDRALLRRH